MRSQRAALATLAALILLAAAEPPTTGWLYIDRNNGSFIFPFTAAQCESFDIYYNSTVEHIFHFYDRTTPDTPFTLLSFRIPPGVGYVEWICNIPGGFAFFHTDIGEYVVKPGTTSACLGDITTAYSFLTYSTAEFASYTRTVSLPTTTVPTHTLPTANFPTGAFSTTILNPILAVTPTASPSLPSLPLSSPSISLLSPPSPIPTRSPSSSSQKPRSAWVAGCGVVAVALVLLILTLVLWRRRRRSVLARASPSVDPQSEATSGLAAGKLAPTDPSSPFRLPAGHHLSGAEFLGGTQQYPFSLSDPCSNRTEPMSDNPIDVPVTGNLVTPIVSQKSSQGAIIPLEADSALPSQRPREALDSGHQASLPKPEPDLASPADPQPPSAQFSDAPANTALETSLLDPTPQLQPHSTTETQEDALDFAAVLGVISRARLSPRERRVIATANNLLIEASSASLDLTRQNTTASSPPPYTD